MKQEILVKFDKPLTYYEATEFQSFYYDVTQFPIDPNVLAEKLNKHFEIDCFRNGKPRQTGEAAICIKWPQHRKIRKPIKLELQQGITIEWEN